MLKTRRSCGRVLVLNDITTDSGTTQIRNRKCRMQSFYDKRREILTFISPYVIN